MELHPSMMAAIAETEHEDHSAILHPAIVAAMPPTDPKQRNIYVHPRILNAEVAQEEDPTPSADNSSTATPSTPSSDDELATPDSRLTRASTTNSPSSPRLRLRGENGDDMDGNGAPLFNEYDDMIASLILTQSAIRAQKARHPAADVRRMFQAISRACLKWQQVTLDPRELEALMATHIHEWDCGVELPYLSEPGSTTGTPQPLIHAAQFRPRHVPSFRVPSDAEIERVLRSEIMRWYRPNEHTASESVTAQEGFMTESTTERILGLPQGWLARSSYWRLRGIYIVNSEVRQYWRRMLYEARQDQAAARRAELCIPDCSTALQEKNNLQVLGRPTPGDLDFSIPPYMGARAVRWVLVDANDQPVLDNEEVKIGVDYEEAFTAAQLADWTQQQQAGAQFRMVRDIQTGEGEREVCTGDETIVSVSNAVDV
jgi:hypothetical protein